MRFLLPLLFCLSAWAQPDPIWKKLIAVPSGPSLPVPQTIPGLAYWWVFTDLTTNASVVQWIDRIQGLVLTNGSSALRPTNSSSGVGFDGTRVLTNLPISASVGGLEISSFVIMDRTATTGAKNPAGYMGNIVNNHGFLVDVGTQSPGKDWIYTKPTVLLLADKIPTNSVMDLEVADAVAVNNGATFYTNGVQSQVLANANWDIQTINSVGKGGGAFYVGFILEIAIYTNTLSSSSVTTLHNYRTTQYP